MYASFPTPQGVGENFLKNYMKYLSQYVKILAYG
jgi:hypothetical protein